MNSGRRLMVLGVALTLAACSGSSGQGGDFALIEFLESGQNNIPRNRQVRFRFSQPVMDGQDLYSRLKIQNVEQLQGGSNFAPAQGFYLLNAEMVIFTPRLPNNPDRSDAGLRKNGKYHVYLSGGPNGLQSMSGDTIPNQQEFIFETNEFFEDVIPAEPPRVIELVAVDATTGAETDISREHPNPFELAKIDNATLVASGRVIDPGAGGAPDYATPWRFELRISESMDPATIDGTTVQLFEIRENAFTTAPSGSPPGYQGDLVSFRVSATVETLQSIDVAGNYDIRIRVTPLQTLVDNTRYRITFAGTALGIDFRRTFSGDNGLTGDGNTVVDGSVYTEPGGLGYVSEFLVHDRAAISASRTLLYDPFIDGIQPENGQTANSEDDLNSALYNPAQEPGTAVGFLSAFGNGVDGPLAASGGAGTTIDTGDTLNEPLGNPFTVNDLNPNDDYLGNPLPGGPITYDSVAPFEMQLESLTISSSSTLKIIGRNPILFRVAGIVQITGRIDIAGGAGKDGGGSAATGGAPGAGGFAGADSQQGSFTCNHRASSCSNFSSFLNACGAAKSAFPASFNGNGPGRGLAGGEVYPYYAANQQTTAPVGTGGGGASHALPGKVGEDRKNAGGAVGTAGPNCSSFLNIRNAGVIGVRGQPGPTYGDREVAVVNMGGSGGGAGGANHSYFGTWPGQMAAGAGGGGGGSMTIVSSGSIQAAGGIIDASGGNGGKGAFKKTYSSWKSAGPAGGGGSGGTIALISGDNIDLPGAFLNATGGAGGDRADVGTTQTCSTCNAGGDGGNGFIFLMDADGEITGFLPGAAGDYDNDSRGMLTIRAFDASRFSSITAITELFPMTAAKPAYLQYDLNGDIIGHVANANQRIRVRVSAALSNPVNPTVADPTSEIADFEIALLEFAAGSTMVTRTGNMEDLNESRGTADRRAFVRVRAAFEYDVGVESALGPFASIDEVKISYTFNGS